MARKSSARAAEPSPHPRSAPRPSRSRARALFGARAGGSQARLIAPEGEGELVPCGSRFDQLPRVFLVPRDIAVDFLGPLVDPTLDVVDVQEAQPAEVLG